MSKITPTDSHRKSLSEAFVNSFGGYPIGYGLGIVVLPLSMGWIQEDPLVANLAITFVYASVSFARSYFLRRVFEKFGIDDNFIRLGINSIKKIKLRISSLFASMEKDEL
ncbi:MAG: DUF7220 family protein [Candidatus Nitrosopumilus sp. bin_32a]